MESIEKDMIENVKKLNKIKKFVKELEGLTGKNLTNVGDTIEFFDAKGNRVLFMRKRLGQRFDTTIINTGVIIANCQIRSDGVVKEINLQEKDYEN